MSLTDLCDDELFDLYEMLLAEGDDAEDVREELEARGILEEGGV